MPRSLDRAETEEATCGSRRLKHGSSFKVAEVLSVSQTGTVTASRLLEKCGTKCTHVFVRAKKSRLL